MPATSSPAVSISVPVVQRPREPDSPTAGRGVLGRRASRWLRCQGTPQIAADLPPGGMARNQAGYRPRCPSRLYRQHNRYAGYLRRRGRRGVFLAQHRTSLSPRSTARPARNAPGVKAEQVSRLSRCRICRRSRDHVAEGKLEDPLYLSPMGADRAARYPLWSSGVLARGNTFMAHHTGFTGDTLGSALIAAGFAAVMVQRDPPAFCLDAIAFRTRPDAEQTRCGKANMLPAPDRPAVLYTG